MDADFVFGETNDNTVFTCGNCSPSIELNVLQCHILINALVNARFDRALFDSERAELDNILATLSLAIGSNQ